LKPFVFPKKEAKVKTLTGGAEKAKKEANAAKKKEEGKAAKAYDATKNKAKAWWGSLKSFVTPDKVEENKKKIMKNIRAMIVKDKKMVEKIAEIIFVWYTGSKTKPMTWKTLAFFYMHSLNAENEFPTEH